MTFLLTSALYYAELGYPVFPCANALQPVPLTPHGFKDATTDPRQIEHWWTNYPQACIGISTTDLLVIDIDGPNNPWLRDELEKRLSLASVPTSLTPGGGKHHLFRKPLGKSWSCTVAKLATQVDTRTTGGYIVVPPSIRPDGSYRWVPGSELDVPLERLAEPPAWLIERLDQVIKPRSPTVIDAVSANPIPAGQRNATLARLAGSMRRVGMSQLEITAALQQVNQDRCQPSLVPTEVEQIAASVARYEPDQVATAMVEDHWGQVMTPEPEIVPAQIATPQPLPDELLRVPGFISELTDYCLATAPYPNPVLAFAGALALQSFLAARKVRDSGDNRTNMYLLGLAHSASGKDWPRKINTRILHEVGLADCLGDRFASSEGIQDALFVTPSMLMQTDEIDSLLQSISKSRDERYENIMATLLTLYSSANSVFPMRRKAGKESPGVIDQPSLTVFGTAIPNHYYQSLNERMLTNGFFARMIILECHRRGTGQDARVLDLPGRVLETAHWWRTYQPGHGDLQRWHCKPIIVEATQAASKVFLETRLQAEQEYDQAEAKNDPVGTTLWGRVHEQVRKLALIYAVSENHLLPQISATAATWANQLIIHQARRLLQRTQSFVADNPFHAECLKLLRKLREAPGQQLAHSVLLKRMKLEAKRFQEIISTLILQGDIVPIETDLATGNRRKCYQLTGVKN